MKLNWDSLLEPIFLFILSLIAGTLWVIVPIQQDPPPVVEAAAVVAPPPVAVPVSPPPKLSAKVVKVIPPDPELERIERDRPQLLATASTVQMDARTTAESLQAANSEQQRVDAAIQKERQRLEDLKKASGANDPKQENRAAPPKLAEVERVEDTLRSRKTEIAKLETELNNTHNPFEKQVASLPKALPATKAPVLVELFHDRAIPLDKKHFHFTTKWKGPMLATRDSEGESVEEIKKPDSDFFKLLASIKPAKQYLACLLNDDSFEIFREVRNIAREKGVNVGWEPINSSGGKITIYPIHFTNKPERTPKTDNGKPLPRVTSIIE